MLNDYRESMGSLSSDKLPVIHFSKSECARPGTSSWCAVRTEVCEALEAYGCFELVFDEIQSHAPMLSAVGQLFDLPLEVKAKFSCEKFLEGYSGSSRHMPLYESMGIDNVLNFERLQRFVSLMWPNGNSKFCQTVHSSVKELSRVEEMVMRMVFENYDVGHRHDSYKESTTFSLRVTKYKAPSADESSNIGLHTHTDKGFVTILGQNHVNGLEIQGKNGDWIRATPSASSVIVMIGDACMVWSNGRLHCPPHRVVMNVEDETRYSLGLFSYSKDTVQAPEELIDDDHPLLFKPFDQMAFRLFIRTQEGRKAKCAIKVYCGV